MQTNLLWTGREYHSLENCLVNSSENGTQITSTIIGYYNNAIYKVDYRIETDRHWETVRFAIQSRHNNQVQSISYERDGRRGWLRNGIAEDQFAGCIDIDIPLTPCTNTLPINRLRLAHGEQREIEVMYINLLEGRITPVRQKYIRLSDNTYRYENIPNDFEAVIQVDEQGFVVDYPALFVRTAAMETNYA